MSCDDVMWLMSCDAIKYGPGLPRKVALQHHQMPANYAPARPVAIPDVAPATNRTTSTSLDVAPATASSPNFAPARKSHAPKSPNVTPATKSDTPTCHKKTFQRHQMLPLPRKMTDMLDTRHI